MVGFVFIGPCCSPRRPWSRLGQVQLASDFVDQYVAGGDIYTLLDDLIDDSTLNQSAST